jgi:iron(III) transport system substrate-binding protein
LLATAGAGLGVAAVGRVPALAQDGGEVTVYSGRNEDFVGPIFDTFQETTGVSLEVRYGDTAELAAAILEEGDNSPADVYLAQDAGALGAIQQEGRFIELPDDLLGRVDPRFRSPEAQWVGITGRARVAVYNTEMVEASEMPASIKDFTDPKWQGQVGWAPTNGSFQSFVTAFRVLEGDDAARAWLEGMVENDAVVFEGNSPIVRAVGAGELQVGLVNHYYLYEIQDEENQTLPAQNHFFEGGDVGNLINVAGAGVLSTSGNQEGALQLIDFLLSDEGQTYFAENTSEYPLAQGIAAREELTPIEELESPDIDLSDLSDLEGTLELLADVGVV